MNYAGSHEIEIVNELIMFIHALSDLVPTNQYLFARGRILPEREAVVPEECGIPLRLKSDYKFFSS
jgi:hypothetical protein